MSEEEKGEAIIVSESDAPAPSTGIVPGKIRYPALICSCLLAFGGYLVFDLCATLQDELMDYLDIDNTKYSLLYVVYAWTNCLMVLIAGLIIDNTSNRLCAMIFCTLAFFGQTVLSFGVQYKQFYLMLAGRILFGTGLGSICVTQNTISNTYFRGADLATAFAATLTMSRIGSVTNFLLTPSIYKWFKSKLNYVFWYGTGTTLLSALAAAVFFVLDKRAEAKKIVISASKKSRKIKWRDLKDFPALYWILCVICSCYYINIFALMAVLPDFLKKRNNYSSEAASMISSCIYFMAIPCVPIFGRLVDNVGKRVIILAVSVSVMIPFDLILGLTDWNPIPFLCIAGASYSAVASTLWPCICMVVRDEAVGTANGIATSIQMIGIGSANLIVGVIKDSSSYTEVMLFLLGCTSLGFVLSIVANILDKKQFGGLLNNFRPLKDKKEETESINTRSDDHKEEEEEANESNDPSKPLLKV